MDKNSKKTDFIPFKVGTVFNELPNRPLNIVKRFSKIVLRYPSRLEAMAIDPSKIAANNNLKYTPGQIDFTIKIFKTVTINVTENEGEINISNTSKRSTLIKHATALMRNALNVNDGLSIDVVDEINLRHCGLGSSSGLIASIACAINELYGKPISDRKMVKYLAQNHGEEIDDDPEMISPVQCIGGSAACGTHEGGLIIIAGENIVVKTMKIPEDYEVVIGVPLDFTHPDAKYLMDKEVENLHKFLECGKKHGPNIAYTLFHECFPDMEEGSIKAIGNLIFDYRYNMGSIENCSFVYPPMVEMAKSVAFLKDKGLADVLTISSVGPGMFAITHNADACEKAFKEKNMKTIRTKIHNGRYEIINLT